MNEALIAAIKDRISLGWTKEQIAAEVLAAGHTEQAFDEAYEASLRPTPISSPGAIFGIKDILKKTNNLFFAQWRLGLSGLMAMLLVLAIGGGALFGLMVGQYVSGQSWLGLSLVLIIALLGILATTAVGLAVLHGLLKRFDSQDFVTHLRSVLNRVMPVLLVSFYVGVLTQVGYMLFFVPGLILAVLLSFVVPGVLLGETSGIKSLTYSASLVYGRFFKVLIAYIVNAGLLMLVTLLIMAFIAVATMEPMSLVLIIPLALVAFLAMAWWQVCFLVALFELLKAEPNQKTLPLGERFWQYFSMAVVGIATFLLAVFVFLLSFGMAELSDLENMGQGGMVNRDGGMMQDIVRKQFLQTAVLKANMVKDETGNYYSVCNEVSLPEGVDCRAGEDNFRFEIKLSDGYYCVDREIAETFPTKASSQSLGCVR